MPKFNYSHVCISNLVFQVNEKIIDLSPRISEVMCGLLKIGTT